MWKFICGVLLVGVCVVTYAYVSTGKEKQEKRVVLIDVDEGISEQERLPREILRNSDVDPCPKWHSRFQEKIQ